MALPGYQPSRSQRLSWCRTFAGNAGTVAAAREFVDEWLDHRGASGDVRDRVTLVVSELCTNAVAASPQLLYRVSATFADGGVRVCISNRADPSLLPPRNAWQADRGMGPCGRGLGIAATLADAVAVERDQPHRVRVAATFRTR